MATYGDQLTRRNLDLARGLKDGVAGSVGGLKIQVPVLCAPWHIKQDLLEVRDKTTLQYVL